MMGAAYRAFEPGADPDRARAAFVAHYGVEPAEMIATAGALLVGPVPQAASDPAQLTTGASEPAPLPEAAPFEQLALFGA